MSFIFPYSAWDCLWLAPAALFLDLLLGDPTLPWPHPVRFVGAALDRTESLCRAFASRGKTSTARAVRAKFAGAVAIGAVASGAFGLVRLAVSPPLIGPLLALYFAWAGLAMGCLLDTGFIVLNRVEKRPLEVARESVSWLVSRETGQMDRQTLRKTLADTLSENFTDAFMAPFFWLLATGPAGLWFYKAVSCGDSQWGYLTPRWRNLGFAAAKGDDCLAYVPARLGAFALYLTDRLARLSHSRAWRGRWPGIKRIAADARGMPSPNSGWSMAACAWLCGCRMAGPCVYFGKLTVKPWLGPPEAKAGEWNENSLLALLRLSLLASVTGAFMVYAPFLAFWLLERI